jgi:CDP-diacylglycerol--inositol 3-phosphatidyltransferase
VLLYVPNLVGYGRVACTLSSLALMIVNGPQYWLVAILLYLTSFVGDLVDGMLARKLNQCSTFGGVLDMITDRCSTAGLLFVLAGDYGQQQQEQSHQERLLAVSFLSPAVYRLIFLCLMLLDISSHWVQMHSSLSLGAHHKSKEGNADKNFLVRWFYQYYYFFGYLCVGAEFTYILVYVQLHFSNNNAGLNDDDASSYDRIVHLIRNAVRVLFVVCLPGCVAKQLVNLAQLLSSCYAIAHHDAVDATASKAKVA